MVATDDTFQGTKSSARVCDVALSRKAFIITTLDAFHPEMSLLNAEANRNMTVTFTTFLAFHTLKSMNAMLSTLEMSHMEMSLLKASALRTH